MGLFSQYQLSLKQFSSIVHDLTILNPLRFHDVEVSALYMYDHAEKELKVQLLKYLLFLGPQCARRSFVAGEIT